MNDPQDYYANTQTASLEITWGTKHRISNGYMKNEYMISARNLELYCYSNE